MTSGNLFVAGSSVVLGFGGQRTSPPLDEWRVQLTPGYHFLKFTSKGYLNVDLGEIHIDPEREAVVDVVLRRE